MKKTFFKKINSVYFAPKWISISVLIGFVLPVILKIFIHKFLWQFCVAGSVSLLIFFIVFAIEMSQDFGKVPYYEKVIKERFPFDSKTQQPVIHCSICTGEKMAGFKNKITGEFIEVMPIKSSEDEKRFLKIYELKSATMDY